MTFFVESQFGLGSVVLIVVAVISFGLSLQCCKGCIVCCLHAMFLFGYDVVIVCM